MSAHARQPDIAVVGAGPAGSSAAIQLSRRGFQVSLFEQARFPRNKVCGGCLSGDAVECLQQLSGSTAQSIGTAVERVHFVIGRRRMSVATRERCRIIPRDVLDARLADCARAAGATLHVETPVRLVESKPGRFAIIARGELISPRSIFWAAGVTGLPALLKLPKRKITGSMAGQAWSVLPGKCCPPPGEISMHWFRGGYVGMATLDSSRCLVALAVETRSLEGQRPWDALRAANPDAEILKCGDYAPAGDVIGTAGFPWRPGRVGAGNLLLIGDAAGFEEPFRGEGMGQAFRSAAAAVDAIACGLSDVQTLRRYSRALAKHRHVRRRTRWLGYALRHRLTHAAANATVRLPMNWLEPLLSRIYVKNYV